MDKLVMKTLFRAAGLQVPDWVAVDRQDWDARSAEVIIGIEKTLRYPLFVKPANLGSSVGISKVASAEALSAAISTAAEFDRRIVVETAVDAPREFECGVLGNASAEASAVGEIVPSREFYDYEAKYLDAGSRTTVPADVDAGTREEIRRQAVMAFRAIDGAGLARVDFLVSRTTSALFVNEINTMPGFTTISMFPKLWNATGVDYPTLVDRLIVLGLERHDERQRLRTSAST
jgi:D-alanine-D-alanine ligase